MTQNVKVILEKTSFDIFLKIFEIVASDIYNIGVYIIKRRKEAILMNKKKVLSLVLVLMLCVSSVVGNSLDVYAEEAEDISFEELLTENALIGYMNGPGKGVYYMEGISVIRDAGNGKIGVGGNTKASQRCTVSINVVVERYFGNSWVRVTSYSDTRENSLYAAVSKSLYVSGGYYYRVRSVHSAHTDTGNSFTSPLWMP